MYGINVVALIMFSVFSALAVQLCRCREETRTKTTRILCSALLLYNLCHYVSSPLSGNGLNLPVEFSTVSYFAVPIILLTRWKKLQSWGAYSGLIAGFFYYMTMIITGGNIYDTFPPYQVYIAMCCHGILFLCGLVTIGTQQCASTDWYKLLGGIAYIVLRAQLLRPLLKDTDHLFIYGISDGVYVRQVLPQGIWDKALPVYYIVMVCLVLLSIKIFFKLNQLQYKKYVEIREKSIEPLSVTFTNRLSSHESWQGDGLLKTPLV